MRKSLIVGIDHYQNSPGLYGCVNDAHSVKAVLERHSNGTINLDVKLLVATSANTPVNRSQLKDSIEDLFSGDSEIALLYFAGHGHLESSGGYILASDSSRGDEGVSLDDVLTYANKSKARNKIIILDSCHSGIAGNQSDTENTTRLSEGLTILTASTKEQYASEENGSGVFTTLLVDALNGPAANLLGEITPGSIYAHIDRSLGSWDQRPVFKTNVKSFVSLRSVEPPIPLSELQRITEFFPSPGSHFKLDPSFEPQQKGRDPGMPAPDPEHTRTFSILQKYNRANLVVPVGVPHMWDAAMQSKSCQLTVLGEHYRRLRQKARF